MSSAPDKEPPSLADEVKELAHGIRRREKQLVGLKEKLDAAVDELGLDLSAISLPANLGAILSSVPREEMMPDHEEQSIGESLEPGMPPARPDTREGDAHLEVQAPGHVVVRDPAVVELLKQSAGMAQRQEHTRVSVENLDRKVDALARELHRWRREDDRRESDKSQAAQTFMGMSLIEVKRLVGMAVFFLIIAVVWYLLVD